MAKLVGNLQLISWDSDPLTEQQLSVIESAIGPLPDDYRRFLLTSNGGRFARDAVRVQTSDRLDGEWFYVDALTVLEAEFPPEILRVVIDCARLDLIKVAECGDSQYLMQLNAPRPGSIYYWMYETEDHWEAEEAGRTYLPEDKSLCAIAPSFTGFVSNLVAGAADKVSKLEELERTAENYAKFGDQFFDETKAFFDAMTLDELNECQSIHYAANWKQALTSKLLIDRGVDLHEAVMYCTNSFEITRMMIEAGATDQELQVLLLSAATSIAATSIPEQKHKIIMYLLDRGIRPDFDDPEVVEEWRQGMNQIYGKKILSFLLRTIQFPASIATPMRRRITSRM